MWNSFKNNKTGIILMFLSSLFVCSGQLLWKLSSSGNILYLFIGFILYGIGALVMIKAYGYGKLSVLQPMLSVNYIITIILGYFILHEAIGTLKIIGIVAIIIGVLLIGGSDDE